MGIGHESAGACSGVGSSRHVTADSCSCQGCSNDLSAGAFRGTIGSVGLSMHLATDARRAVFM